MRYAVMDIGSHSIKLFIFDERLNELYKTRVSGLDLAEGLKSGSELRKEDMQKSLGAIKELKQKIKENNVDKVRVVGTAVLRDAKNAKVFVDLVKKEADMDVEVVSQEDEAKIFFKGVVRDMVYDADVAAINIGGRSTELIIGDIYGIKRIYNIPIGTPIITEKFLKSDPPTEEEWGRAIKYIREILQQVGIIERGNYPCFFTGEVKTLSETFGKILGFEWEKCSFSPSHPIKSEFRKYEEFNEALKKFSKEERRKNYPSNPVWMDHATPGLQVYIEIARLIGSNIIVPSEKDLREGLMYDTIRG
jgi:exopolyphosphatase/guanosine-5'-triphosphate,3'-diphosphate pyrophosphatase